MFWNKKLSVVEEEEAIRLWFNSKISNGEAFEVYEGRTLYVNDLYNFFNEKLHSRCIREYKNHIFVAYDIDKIHYKCILCGKKDGHS